MNVDETPGSPESPWAQKWWCTTAFSHCHQNQYAHISSIQTYSNCISGDVCKTRQHESPAPNQASVFWFALISNQNKSQVRMMDHALYVVRYLVLGGYLFHTVTNVCIFVCVCVSCISRLQVQFCIIRILGFPAAMEQAKLWMRKPARPHLGSTAEMAMKIFKNLHTRQHREMPHKL